MKVVSPAARTGCLYPSRKYSCYSFLLEVESTPCAAGSLLTHYLKQLRHCLPPYCKGHPLIMTVRTQPEDDRLHCWLRNHPIRKCKLTSSVLIVYFFFVEWLPHLGLFIEVELFIEIFSCEINGRCVWTVKTLEWASQTARNKKQTSKYWSLHNEQR